MKKIHIKALFALFVIFVFLGKINSTIGIGTKFATVVLEKLELGGVYNLTKLRNLPLIVINSGNSEIEVAVEIEPPHKSELKEGYEPIPDPSWIKIVPDRFKLKPKESYFCDVVISIPNDPALVGRHFQAKIWSRTAGEDLFGAGVVNRIFLSIGTLGPESVQKAKRKELLYSINFDVDPREIYLTVPVGKKVDVYKEFEKTIKVINKGKSDIVVKLESVSNRNEERIIAEVPQDYEFTPDTGFLMFGNEKIKVKKNSIKDVSFYLKIPDSVEYKEKKYMFLVKIYPVKPEVPIEFYVRVFVNTK